MPAPLALTLLFQCLGGLKHTRGSVWYHHTISYIVKYVRCAGTLCKHNIVALGRFMCIAVSGMLPPPYLFDYYFDVEFRLRGHVRVVAFMPSRVSMFCD